MYVDIKPVMLELFNDNDELIGATYELIDRLGDKLSAGDSYTLNEMLENTQGLYDLATEAINQ